MKPAVNLYKPRQEDMMNPIYFDYNLIKVFFPSLLLGQSQQIICSCAYNSTINQNYGIFTEVCQSVTFECFNSLSSHVYKLRRGKMEPLLMYYCLIIQVFFTMPKQQ